MSDLSIRLQRAKQRPRYLAELNRLLRRTVTEADLLGVEATTVFLAESKQRVRSPSWSADIPFSRKDTVRFRDFVDRLRVANTSSVYLWLPSSVVCGLSPAVSLAEIDFSFGFDFSVELIVLLTTDLDDRIRLEFSEENGSERLNIECEGAGWGHVLY